MTRGGLDRPGVKGCTVPEDPHRPSRRGFLKAALAAAAAPYVIPASALGGDGRPAASERIVMGSIGSGGRGQADMRALMGDRAVQCVAVCDVDDKAAEGARRLAEGKRGGAGCTAYRDFRDLLDRGDLDAVSIGTPDHWHAIPTIEACRRGLDVYVEKPLSLTIVEGRAMVSAARRHGRGPDRPRDRRDRAAPQEDARGGRPGRRPRVRAVVRVQTHARRGVGHRSVRCPLR
jgi:hypothetical protein